jgi:hypothetical protein
MSSPTVRYSLARLGLFLGSLGLLYLLGLRDFLLVAMAIVTSGVLSYFLLTAPRVAMGMQLAARWRSRMNQLDRQARAEDADNSTPPESVDEDRQGSVGGPVHAKQEDPGGHVVRRSPHQAV